MLRLLRSLVICLVVGLTVGVVVGGSLGRVFMRLVFLAERDALGFQTAMGATVGEFTSGGTAAIYVFGGIAGVALALSYAVGRTLLPSSILVRTVVFTLGTTAFMLGQIVRSNREDFVVLPVTLSLLLVVASVALTAAPVPILIERFAPDRERQPGRFAVGLVTLGMTGFAVFAVTGIITAYGQ